MSPSKATAATPITTSRAACAIAVALAALPLPLAAASYPTNDCVAAKQKEAGRYCTAVLRSWSTWDKNRKAGVRDAALSRANARLAHQWMRAEARSSAFGVDCADATATAGGVRQLVDDGVASVVAAINDGLDLGAPSEAACGRRLLRAAATKCATLLRAEGKHVRNLAGDASGSRLVNAREASSATFARAWTSATAKACPTTGTIAGVEGLIDGIAAAVVRDTTISPNVDDTTFTTESPAGPISYQGRSFAPTCMAGTPYHFFVKRGSVNKLLYYYQGGGACWDQVTCALAFCDTSVDPAGRDNPNSASGGFFDLSNPANPFRDWNIVFVPYCSCDLHYGDAAQDYPLHVEHRGYQNARVVEKWAREHFVEPEEIFVAGSSAGGLGAFYNAPLHHAVWPSSRFQVLGDGSNAVVTQDFLDDSFPHWNFTANLPADIPGLRDALLHADTFVPGYAQAVAKHFSNTRWAHYVTAFDGGRGTLSAFYNFMLRDEDPLAAINWWGGSCAFNAEMRAQALATAAAVPSNYRYYIGTGTRHVTWGRNKVYTDTTGGVPLIVDWIAGMIDGTPAWTNVECTDCGLLLPGDLHPDLSTYPYDPPAQPFGQRGSDIVVDCGP